jgi:hypothetical protein
LADFINITEFNENEIELIMSFDKDSNGIRYTPAMIGTLDILKIKESIKKVLFALFNLDFYFFNDEIENHSLDLHEKWKDCAKGGNPNVELKDIVNM